LGKPVALKKVMDALFLPRAIERSLHPARTIAAHDAFTRGLPGPVIADVLQQRLNRLLNVGLHSFRR
jgi:hypothetical protein